MRHDPQDDDPELETDVGQCPDCSGDGCGDSDSPQFSISLPLEAIEMIEQGLIPFGLYGKKRATICRALILDALKHSAVQEHIREGRSKKKEKSVFASEQEAYDFCQKVYQETGGVTPELRRAYDFYLKNYNDDCPPPRPHP